MTPQERSLVYQGFAEAFRNPGGGHDILDEAIAPPPSRELDKAFMEAFDQALHKGACSLYESAHITWDQTALFEDLVRAYDHFGLRRKDIAELPDHISVELEFLHFLTYLEHQNAGDAEVLASLHRAQHDFLERHIVPLAVAVRDACATAAAPIVTLTESLCAFLDQEMAVLSPA
jgi:DMSO reductase family type II enzyme chaperone